MRSLALALMLMPLAALAGWMSDARENCELAYPGNQRFEGACFDREKASRKALLRLERESSAHREVVRRCQRVNPGAAGGVRWSYALVCARRALSDLRR